MKLASAEIAVARLEQLVAGLLFVSESDQPLRVVQLGLASELDEQGLLQVLEKDPDSAISRQSLDELFARAVADQPWHGLAERQSVQRYRALLDFLSAALSSSRVYRIGLIEVEVYAVGKTSDGRWLGVATKVIET